MRFSMSVYRMVVVVPAILVSTLVTLMVLAMFPLALLLIPVGAVGLVLLGAGIGEDRVVRFLARGRTPTPSELQVLWPVLERLRAHEVSDRRLYIHSRGGGAPPLAQVLHNSLIIKPWLVDALYYRRLSVDEAAAVIAHPVGANERYRPPLELMVYVWTLPWQYLVALGRGIGRGFARLPLMRFAWRVRFVVGIAAIAQPIVEDEPPIFLLLGVVTAGFVALTYIIPAADRAGTRLLEEAGDEYLVAHRLGGVFAHLMRRHHEAVAIARLQRLHGQLPPRQAQESRYETPAQSPLAWNTASLN